MRTLITGATGFLGSSLLRNVAFDDLHTVSLHSRRTSQARAIHHVGDIRDAGFLNELSEIRFDRIIHFAWQGLPSLTPENNLRNLKMTLDFFDVMIKSGVREINVTGSCLEYGDLLSSVTEEILGSNVGDFGRTKLAILDYLTSVDIPYRWFRVFYAYGPNQHSSSLLHSAYQSVKNGSPFKLQNPNISHDFIYVDDVTRAIGMLLSTPNSYGVFNIGSNNSTSVGRLTSLLLNAMNGTPILKDDEMASLRADFNKLRTSCGWNPLVSLEEGTRKFLEWCENQ